MPHHPAQQTRAEKARDLETAFDEIATLLPPRLHPEAERIESQAIAWYDRADLPADTAKRERLRGSQVGWGVAASWSRVSYEAAALWARISLWYLAFDDVCAEDAAARDLPGFLQEAGLSWRMLHDATPPESFNSPFPSALGILLAELDALAPAITANRVRQALRDYLFAAAWEAASRARGTLPSYEDYLAYFRHAAFFMLNVEFVEISPGAFLEEETRRHPQVRAMRAAVCDLMSLANYICSAPVEESLGTSFGPAPVPGSIDYRERCLEQARIVARIRDTYAGDPALVLQRCLF